MDDLQPLLERVRDQLVPSGGGFERLAARRARRRRNQRVVAGVLALTLFVGVAAGLLVALLNGGEQGPRPAARLFVHVGGIPIDIAFGEGAVWVGIETRDDGGGEIVRIDPATGDVSARIPLEEVGAVGVGEGSVWVANLRGGTVTRIDPMAADVDSIIAMPPLAYEVAEGDRAFFPNDVAVAFGRVWVSTARGSVASIDPGDESVRLETGDPASILGGLSAGGGSVWAWNDFVPPGAEVWRIDPGSGATTRFPVLQTVQAGGAGSAGLLLLHTGTGDVSLVDPAGGVTGVAGVGEQAVAMAVRDPLLFVASVDGDAFVIDQGSGDIALLARLSERPTAMSAEADAIWVGLASGRVVRLPSSAPPPFPIVPADAIVFAQADTYSLDAQIEVAFVPAAGGDVTPLTTAWKDEMVAAEPRWSPDGSRIAFVKSTRYRLTRYAGDGDIHVMDANGTDIQRLTQGLDASSPTWSPDGSRIAYVRNQGLELVVMRSDGSDQHVIASRRGYYQWPAWSPDGRVIAYQSNPGANQDVTAIFTIKPDGTGERQLTDGSASEGFPAWSLDGSQIAYSSGERLWIMNADGTDAHQVTQCRLPCVADFAPAWSPDAIRLVFVRQEEEGGRAATRLYTVDIATRRVTPLTPEVQLAHSPSWRSLRG